MKRWFIFCALATMGLLGACNVPLPSAANPVAVATPVPDPQNLEMATFAGGCFWSMQRMLDEVPGVITTTVGFTGGTAPNPTYAQVSAEITGHAEAVEVIFDRAQISYAALVDAYWHDIDPVAVDRQFCDQGSSYRSAIFYHDAEQQQLATGQQRGADRLRSVCSTYRHRNPCGHRLLPRRGVSSEILSEESQPLCALPCRLRTRCTPSRNLGH